MNRCSARLLCLCTFLSCSAPGLATPATVEDGPTLPTPPVETTLTPLLVSVSWPGGAPGRAALTAEDGALTLLVSTANDTTSGLHQVSWLTARAAGTLVASWSPPSLSTTLTFDGATVTAEELLRVGRGAGVVAAPITDETCGFVRGTARLVEGQLRVKALVHDAQGERAGLLRFSAPDSTVEWTDADGVTTPQPGDVTLEKDHFLVRTKTQRLSGQLLGAGVTRSLFGALSCPREATVSTAAK